MSLRQPILLPTPETVGDAELVARAVTGDRWSKEVLYRRHAGYLLGIAARLLRSRGDGEEVVQDTFIVGFGELASLREPAALRSWLAQIAVRLVRRRVRRSRLFRLFGFAGGEDGRGLLAQAAPALAPDARAELALLDRALVRLRTEPQIAWTLRRVEGLSLAEVASACACSLATAKRRIAEADAWIERFTAGARGGT